MFEDLKPELSASAPLPEESCAPAELTPNTQDETGALPSNPATADPPATAAQAPVPPFGETMAGHNSHSSHSSYMQAPVPPPAETMADDPLEPPASDDSEVAGWKQALRWDFERWLASVDEIPEEDLEEEGEGAPDLYSFYAQLAAANAESRKANRRTAEAISQWVETVSRFDTSLAPLRETISQLLTVQAKEGQMSRVHCLALVELLDRLQRIAKAFLCPPPRPRRTWWGGGGQEAWCKAWDSQRQAFAIVLSHLEELLSKEGVVRLESLGQRFDPLLMTAVAAEPDPSRPAQTVIEELAAGYRRHDELLRPAQVKVTTK